jgi:AraC-like DNA-binding protein
MDGIARVLYDIAKPKEAMDMSLLQLDPLLLSSHHAHAGNSPSVRTPFGERTVDRFEFDYMLEGEGEIVTDGVPIPTTTGTLFFRWPGLVVEGIAPYHCYYVRFLPEGGTSGTLASDARSVAASLAAKEWRERMPFPAVMKVRDISGMTRLFSELHLSQYRVDPAGAFATRILLMQVLQAVHEEWRTAVEGLSDGVDGVIRDRIRRTALWLERNPQEKRTLDGLAAQAGYSRFAFCRRFKEVMGEPPLAYGNRMRVAAAQRMLVETLDPVVTILERCGFESGENFYRQFRRHSGTSPQAYRRRNTGRSRTVDERPTGAGG